MQTKEEDKTQIKSVDHNAIRRSYARAARQGREIRNPSSDDKRRLARKQCAQLPQALRCDKRSFKIKPTKPQGAIPHGSLARGVKDLLSFEAHEIDLTEDIRMDRAGLYYIQIKGTHFAVAS